MCVHLCVCERVSSASMHVCVCTCVCVSSVSMRVCVCICVCVSACVCPERMRGASQQEVAVEEECKSEKGIGKAAFQPRWVGSRDLRTQRDRHVLGS